jgi:hypothetical protein
VGGGGGGAVFGTGGRENFFRGVEPPSCLVRAGGNLFAGGWNRGFPLSLKDRMFREECYRKALEERRPMCIL